MRMPRDPVTQLFYDVFDPILRPLVLLIFAGTITASVATWVGGYALGSQRAERHWHLKGYAEAEDHYQVMLSSYSECKQTWDELGELWRKYPNMTIIGESLDSEDDWKLYVQYHAQRNGWKDAGVFRRLEDKEREYLKEKASRPECTYGGITIEGNE